MSKIIVAITAFLLLQNAFAQKQTEHINRIWAGYFNQTRFSDKWGIWAEVQVRTKDDFVKDIAQGIIRVGLTYYVSDATKLTAGYAYINDFPADNHKNISVPEHRPWQQIQWHTKYGRKKMMQWFRLEERFKRKVLNDDVLANGYSFHFRMRYNIWYEVPFYKNGTDAGSWSFIVNDEVHVNFGKEIVNNYFDQNRFFVGVKYQTGNHNNLQLGYMNIFQQLASGNRYRSFNVLLFFFFQNIDLRKKKS
ncbi:MAG: DUF2490 domain-containing protein [Chitinophagaceae bacterium]|nr:DUF2490 domain-containing protein [Chitinophagaceae bacterium]